MEKMPFISGHLQDHRNSIDILAPHCWSKSIRYAKFVSILNHLLKAPLPHSILEQLASKLCN